MDIKHVIHTQVIAMPILRNARGSLLVHTLVVTVLIALSALVISQLATQLSDRVSRSGRLSAVRLLELKIKHVMEHRDFCPTALRSGNGSSTVSYDGSADVPVTKIVMKNQTSGLETTIASSLKVKNENLVTPTVKIGSMYLAKNGQRGLDMKYQGVTYATFQTELRIQFKSSNDKPMFGGDLAERRVPVTILAQANAPFKVAGCPAVYELARSTMCDAANILSSNDCPASPPSGLTRCVRFYHLFGFDSKGAPICKCAWTCR